jgi:hypothetical protein
VCTWQFNLLGVVVAMVIEVGGAVLVVVGVVVIDVGHATLITEIIITSVFIDPTTTILIGIYNSTKINYT